MKKKVLRIATVSGSLGILLKGQLKFLNRYYEIVGVASDPLGLKKIAKEENIRVKPIRMARKINIPVDFISLIKLYFLFKKEKPFIVHSITPKAGMVSMVAAYLAGVPYRLHTFTGLIFPTSTGFTKKLLIFFDKIICFCATNIYPEGQGVKNDLIQYKITKKEMKILGNGNVNGIDLSYFDPNLYSQNDIAKIRQDIGVKPSDFIFLYVGRIVSDKGINELIASFLEVEKKHQNVKLVLVGLQEKKLDPISVQVEEEIKHNANIISVGWQQDVRPFFALSNMFVFPSYREGFPNVVLQAGAMGMFCIVTDINGSNEIIQHNINGKIIPVKDSNSLFEEMSNCLNSKDLYQYFDLNNRKIIEEKYDHRIIWNAILEEYNSITKT